METQNSPDLVKIHKENIERSNKARCHLCNSWTREKGCDHYGPDVHYKDFDSMVARINNLEAGLLTHARINGDLIKQKSELLEALIGTAKALKKVLDATNPDSNEYEWIGEANEVITKATGINLSKHRILI